MSRTDHIAALRLPLDQLPDPLPIPVIEKPFDVTIRPPGSKSITNRALLLAALADGTSELRGPLIDADDAQVMLRAIQQLGAKVEIVRGGEGGGGGLDIVRITGVNGRWKIPAGQTITLNLNNAGTATRFLTAAAILAPADSGGIIIDGDARMRERPIGELVDLLERMGVRVDYVSRRGFPPIHVRASASLADLKPRHDVGTTASSQFISALMLIAPFLPRGIHLFLKQPVTSFSYITMTDAVLHDSGVRRTLPGYVVDDDDHRVSIRVPSLGERLAPPTAPNHEEYYAPRPFTPLPAFTLDIEPDASGATYFIGATALTADSCTWLQGWNPLHSAQPDTYFGEVVALADGLHKWRNGGQDHAERQHIRGTGRLRAIDFNLSDMPDTAMTAAAIACFASPTPDNPTATTTLRGLRTLRVKETDRLAALQTELSKLGARVEIFKDNDDEGLRITPPPPSALGPAPSALFFDTYNDHRMAMALALIGLRRPNVFIRNPACVAKTYPTFWQDLARLYEPRTK